MEDEGTRMSECNYDKHLRAHVRGWLTIERIDVRKLHTLFNVMIRRECGAVVPACDGPDCIICRDVAREFPELLAGPDGRRA